MCVCVLLNCIDYLDKEHSKVLHVFFLCVHSHFIEQKEPIVNEAVWTVTPM